MTTEETAKLLTFLAVLYPKLRAETRKEEKQKIVAWSLVLADLDYTLAQAAAIKLARTLKFPPGPADIIVAAKSITPSSHPAPDLAWQEVKSAVDRCGLNITPPPWSHPFVAEAVRRVGYTNLCVSELDQSSKFLKFYEAIITRALNDQENLVVASIIGIDLKQLAESKSVPPIKGGLIQ